MLRLRAAFFPQPAKHQPPRTIVEALRCVETAARVDLAALCRDKALVCVRSREIDAAPQRDGRQDQRVLVVGCKEIRALPDLARIVAVVPFVQQPTILPAAQIGAAVERDRAVGVQLADCCADRVIPVAILAPETMVAELVAGDARWWRSNHRVCRVAVPGDEIIIGGERQTRALFCAAHTGVHQRHHAIVYNRAARKHASRIRATRHGCERDRQMLPGYQIIAHRVTPVHGIPVGTVRIVLIEHVVAVAPADQAVWVVHPAGRRQQVIHRAVWISSKRGHDLALFRGGICGCVSLAATDS